MVFFVLKNLIKKKIKNKKNSKENHHFVLNTEHKEPKDDHN